jgi:EmrB/QacA subfamily drug resistance transporter
MTHLDATVVNVALASIRADFGTSFATVQWVVGGYLLALALMLPLNAWLVNRVGAKRLYVICFAAFTFTSLLCGAARSAEQLIAARMLQGMAGGLLTPMSQMMLAQIAGPHLARVAGYMAVPIVMAPVVGPVVAGAILKVAGWPWLFYINLPIGVLAIALAIRLLPADEPARERRPFDALGFFLISPALVGMLFGLDRLPSAVGILSLAAGIALLAVFVVHARRRKEAALVDLRLFANRTFATATMTQFLSNGANLAGQLLLPLFLISGCGYSPVTAGWMLAPIGIGMLCVYPLQGMLTERFGFRMVSAGGAILLTLSTLPVLWMAHNAVVPAALLVALFLRGIGQSAIGVPSLAAAYAAIPRESIPLASTAANIAQRLGGPVGTTLVAIVLSLTAMHGAGPAAFFAALVALVVLQLLVLTSALRLPLR